MPKIAFIIPFFNEERNLKYLIEEWENFFLKNNLNVRNFKFFFVDNGSKDQSKKIIKSTAKKIRYKILNFKDNSHGLSCKFGYLSVIKLKKKFNYILQIDSDNQCDPKYFTKFIKEIEKTRNVFVYGRRTSRKDGIIRSFFSLILRILVFFRTSINVEDINTPYRLMKINELDKVIKNIKKKYGIKKIGLFNSLLTYETIKKFKITWINITFRDRKFGKTKHGSLKMLILLFNLIFNLK